MLACLHSSARDVFGDRKIAESMIKSECMARFGFGSSRYLTQRQLFELEDWIEQQR